MRFASMKNAARAAAAVMLAALCAGVALATPAWAPPGAPQGVTPFAGNGSVSLAWKPTSSATSYTVFRSTTSGATGTAVASAITSTSYTDSSAVNGTAYWYHVVANSGAGSSPSSTEATATPRAATCSGTNAIASENCLPGSQGWKTPNATDANHTGIEGFTTATSIAAGDSVGLKVNGTAGASFHVDIYRTGYYAGDQGRLVGRLSGLTIPGQPACSQDFSTGERSCAGWTTAADITTSSRWTSGVYLLKLVRDDNGAANLALLTVRDDSRVAPALFEVPVNTYEAYNNYGGRSLYTFNSDGNPTVSGTARAVKVSFDRPFQQSISGQHDWYTSADIQLTSWLERQGYDMSYADSSDVHAGRVSLNSRSAILLGAHDEYQSTEQRSALLAARNAGVDIASFGANQMFWRSRYEPSSVTGTANRTLVSYKSTEGGAADPSGTPTGTWRDPAGANSPENALFGSQYVGESSQYFPLFVTAAQGKNRFWRYTVLTDLAAGTKAQVDFNVVGWEWDRRVENGLTPPGTQALSSSPVSGSILQDAGGTYAPGSETSEATIYTAASGAKVWTTGTMNWSLGLGQNMEHAGEPDGIIQQGTANVLADMGIRPTTPSGVTVDAAGALQITATAPYAGMTNVPTMGTGVIGFDRPLDPDTVGPAAFQVTDPAGQTISGDVVYDDDQHTVSFTPDHALDGNTVYRITVATSLHGWNGQGLASPATWTFTTGAGAAPAVTAQTPAANATGVALDDPVTATFDRGLQAASVTSTTAQLKTGSTTVAATVSYDSTTRKVTIDPTQALTPSTTYTATLSTGIKATDGTPLASAVTWSFTTADVITVTSRTPAPLASGMSSRSVVRARFSRDVDPATLTGANGLTLATSGGASVAGAVSYDATTDIATLTPTAALSPGATYTAKIGSGVRGVDGATVSGSTWTFSVALTDPAAPGLTTASPASGASNVRVDAVASATFDRALDPDSLTTTSVRLTGPSGAVSGAIAYAAASNTVTFTPDAPLAGNTAYTVRLTTLVRSAAGQPLAADATWSFTTSGCPCSTMPTLSPAIQGVAVQDGRAGSGPFSRELGVKVAVDQTVRLTELRFFKSPGENGTHTGRVWSSTGARLGSVTFSGETASGWQKQALATPITLKPGRVYVLSVNINATYVVTRNALASPLAGGPLHTVADGANGVFGEAAGDFPTDSWSDSNYFVDGTVLEGAGAPAVPQITATSPLDGESGVATSVQPRADSSVPLDGSTVNATTFTLKTASGTAVPATVSYDDVAQRAKLVPTSPLAAGTTYVARLSTGVHSFDDTPLAAAVQWQFTTADATLPQVLATSPGDAATQVTTATDVRATFSLAMDATTITTATMKLTAPGGATVPASVAYNATTKTAVLTPSAALAASTTYTATLTTAVKATTGKALAAPVTWQFTTSGCPCQLFDAGAAPERTRPVQDDRPGSGPFSYEMGLKISVSQPAVLTAIRYYKSAGETGTHFGRLWTSSGTKIAQVTFSGETASGWQQQALASPVALTPGTAYVVSVGMNTIYSVNTSGLASPLVSGPLASVDDGANGVYGSTAGSFPTESWSDSNYWIDGVVR